MLTVAQSFCELSKSHLFIVSLHAHTHTHSLAHIPHMCTCTHTTQLSTHIGVLIVELKEDYLYLVPQRVTLAG